MTVTSRVVAMLAKLPPAQTRQVAVERDLVTKMPDGAELLADRWYPLEPGRGSPPTVLLRSPYGRRQLGVVGRLFAERGYQVVIQSCRGTFGSGGDWEPLRNEQADGTATLAWVTAQPWFGEALVTFGPSYLGFTQWAVTAAAPGVVRAMALTVTASDFRRAAFYPGGSFALETALTWIHQVENQEKGTRRVLRTMATTPRVVRAAAAALPLTAADVAITGTPVGFFQDWLAHEEPGDLWWDVINFGKDLSTVPPATLVGGWYDVFLPDQVADFSALRAAGRQARLTIGPWTHGSLGGAGTSLRDALEFFDEQLAERPPLRRRAAVRAYVMGSDRWEEFPDWPPPADRQHWHLGAGLTLAPGAVRAGPPERYRYDPTDPTPGIGGPSLLSKSAGPRDQGPRESRSDVVSFTSAVLAEDLTVVGPLAAELHLRCSLEHTDVFVRLCDVSRRGRSTNIADGIRRLGPADMMRQADGSFAVSVPMWPTATTFKAGHRIRLQVSSGAHPMFTRNPGTGDRLGAAAKFLVAEVEVLHDETHPSSVVLPVVRLG